MSRIRLFPSVAAFVGRHRGTFVIAIVIAVTSSSTAVAASFVLGTVNSTPTTTTLNSAVNGAVLQVNNTNNKGGASARGLGITVPAGRAPITVNASAGKATNLDADKLDGLTSAQFARGSKTTVIADRIAVSPSDDFYVLLVLPGLGQVTAYCDDVNGSGALFFKNTTGGAVRLFTDTPRGESSWTHDYWGTTLAADGRARVGSYDDPRGYEKSFQVGAGTGTANRSADVEFRIWRLDAASSGCEFQATAILWSAGS